MGGSHFTKALTKEMKLTFAKAEHLKRNATTAQDPKAVFQAMRPVFNDLQTELQRSLGFFTNLDRTAKIGRVVAMGNAFKLPGLRRYLAQSLGFEIERVEAFRGLVGPEVLATPAFKDNLLSFGVCYGLCLQALGQRRAADEPAAQGDHQDRLIRRKKPWAVVAAAAGDAGLHGQLCGLLDAVQHGARIRSGIRRENQAGKKVPRSSVQEVDRDRRQAALADFKDYKEHGDHLVNNLQGREPVARSSSRRTCLPLNDLPKDGKPDDRPRRPMRKRTRRPSCIATNCWSPTSTRNRWRTRRSGSRWSRVC